MAYDVEVKQREDDPTLVDIVITAPALVTRVEAALAMWQASLRHLEKGTEHGALIERAMRKTLREAVIMAEAGGKP